MAHNKKPSRFFAIGSMVGFMLLCFAGPAQAATGMNFTVTASENVTVDTTGGIPRLALDVGGMTRHASYASGSGTSSLIFTYTTQAGDLDLDGIAVVSPLDLNGGTIKDAGGNALSPLSFTIPVTGNVKIDHPSVAMDFLNNDYLLNGTRYNAIGSFLTAAGGAYARPSSATYYTPSGALQTVAANVARFDHDPLTLAAKGLLIEESRTNYVPNSTFTGITNATYTAANQTVSNWTLEIPSSLTGASTTLTTGSANNIPYLDIRFVGTNPGATTLYPTFRQPGASDATVSNGTITAASAWFGVTSYTGTGGTCGISLQNRSMTSGGSYITGPQYTTSALAAYQPRTTGAVTHGATAARAALWVVLAIPPGASCDVTVRLGAPQLEIGGTVSSYIPTTSAAATRASDGMFIPTGSWFNAAASTLMGQAILTGSGTYADINNNSFSERFQIRIQSGNQYGTVITAGNVVQTVIGSGTYTPGLSKKIALAAQTNDAVLYADGINRGTDNSLVMPTAQNRMRLGAYGASGETLNGTLQMIKYYPARITNTQLQLLTQ